MPRFDLHTHSYYSDGTYSPSELVCAAVEAGLALLAISDHDSIEGVAEAVAAGKRLGLRVLPAVEFDAEWRCELHLLGLGIDINNPALVSALETARERRMRRNAVIVQKLADAQVDITPSLASARDAGSITKLHIALALVAEGYASHLREAFSKYLRVGCVGYHTETRFSPQSIIQIIRDADGIPTLAHPCHIRDNPHALVAQLAAWGLQGVEAYYPASSPAQTLLYRSLAQQHKLLVTSGSDFHGENRPGIALGCAWQDAADLDACYEMLIKRYKSL